LGGKGRLGAGGGFGGATMAQRLSGITGCGSPTTGALSRRFRDAGELAAFPT